MNNLIMNYNTLSQDDKLFEFCQCPCEDDSSVWHIIYPYGYLNATYLHDFWYIKYVFVYSYYRNCGYGKQLVSEFTSDKSNIIFKVTTLNAFNCYKKCDNMHYLKLYHPLNQFSLKSGKFSISNNNMMKPYKMDFISIDVDKNTNIQKEIFEMPLSPFMTMQSLKTNKFSKANHNHQVR